MRYRPPPVLVVMGVSGSGKSTVAELLADRFGWPLCEGDELHSQANIAKMSAGEPLTDSDRQGWLARVHAWISGCVADGTSGVVTCSALKRAYRDELRDRHVVFVHLSGPREVLWQRLTARHGHFMPASLLDSQLDELEPPEADEQALTVDIRSKPAALVAEIIDRLELPVSAP